MATNERITFQRCLEHGISPEQLHEMQPDVKLWIRHKGVSFREVPHMVCWPLHPIEDLKGDISDLATMRYDARVLKSLGLSYHFMRRELKMDDEWMRMLRYTPAEWAELGFTKQCAEDMGRKRASSVFTMDYDGLLLALAAAPPQVCSMDVEH